MYRVKMIFCTGCGTCPSPICASFCRVFARNLSATQQERSLAVGDVQQTSPRQQNTTSIGSGEAAPIDVAASNGSGEAAPIDVAASRSQPNSDARGAHLSTDPLTQWTVSPAGSRSPGARTNQQLRRHQHELERVKSKLAKSELEVHPLEVVANSAHGREQRSQ